MTAREQQRALLLEQQQRVRARVDELTAQMDALTNARRSEFDDDEHDPDGASLSSQWSMLAGLLEAAQHDARQAERAMERLATGEYGICAACGGEIPIAQLEVRPFRELCVACASAAATSRKAR